MNLAIQMELVNKVDLEVNQEVKDLEVNILNFLMLGRGQSLSFQYTITILGQGGGGYCTPPPSSSSYRGKINGPIRILTANTSKAFVYRLFRLPTFFLVDSNLWDQFVFWGPVPPCLPMYDPRDVLKSKIS